VDFYIEKEACNDNNLKCPVQQGLAQVYRAEVFVKEASLVSKTNVYYLTFVNMSW